jgi:putative membrane protein
MLAAALIRIMLAENGPTWRRLGTAVGVCALALLSALPSTPAAAGDSVGAEEQQGARAFLAVEGGKRRCADLSGQDFERVGEFVMGRMAGSTSAHRSMNEQIASTMGERSQEQMHEFMGRRFTRCGGARAPARFGAMMGMMGAMAGHGGGNYAGSGSMMNRNTTRSSDADGDDNTAAIVMALAMLALIAAVGVVLWRRRGSRAGSEGDPLETLRARYARGEIDGEEYERRRQALGGPA